MNTIREAFSFNLRLARGSRTQAEMAEFLGIPFRTYQKVETGTLPTEATMEAITQKLGISEVSLVQLPGERGPVPPEASRLALIARVVLHLPTLKEDELLNILTLIEGVEDTDGVGLPSELQKKARKGN